MNSVKIGTHQMDAEFGLYLPHYTIPAPVPQTKFINIIGRDGAVDLSNAFGDIHYNSREWVLEFKHFDPVNWQTISSQVFNAIHGKRLDFTFDDDPDWFWTGRFIVNSYSSQSGEGTLKVTVTADPYKYKKLPTIVSASVPSTESYSGDIVTLDEGKSSTVSSFVADIYPTQEGNPTPSAPVALTGYTGATVHVAGKNLANFNDATGSAGATVTKIASLNGFNVKTSSNGNYRSGRITDLHLKAGVKYTLSADVDIITNNNIRFGFRRSSNNNLLISTGKIPSSGHYSVSYTPPYDDYAYLIFFVTYGSGGGGEAIFSNVQFEIGNETSFEAYNGNTYSIDWTSNGTFYGGTIDFTTGTLKARPYYPSYSGQALVGPWVSSKDGYAESGTPTSGAEVVDLGGTETTYSLTAVPINTLAGLNNIWASTGDSTVSISHVTLTNNGSKPVVPTVYASSGMTLAWGSYTYTMQAGTAVIPQLVLEPGITEVYITGTGIISFKYTEGSL